MRSFSISEKEYVKFIVDSYNSKEWKKLVLKNLIYSKFRREIVLNDFPGFEILDGESSDKENSIEYNAAVLKGYIPIAEFLNLLSTLEKYSLISIIPYFDTDDFELDVVGGSIDEDNPANQDNVPKKYFDISDHSYLRFLRKNYSYLVNPSQELIDLAKDDFITKEEKRYNKQVRLTLISLFVAISIGLYGIFKSNNPVQMNDNQINKITKEIHSSKNDLYEIKQLLDSIEKKISKSTEVKQSSDKRDTK